MIQLNEAGEMREETHSVDADTDASVKVQIEMDLVDLNVKVGAGESELDLTKLDLTNLSVNTGMGSLDLDLRGSWTHDIHIAIQGGIGEVTLHLPDQIGTRVEVTNGLGSVNGKGLNKDGKAYVNESYGKSPNTLYIRIDNGTGKVNLES